MIKKTTIANKTCQKFIYEISFANINNSYTIVAMDSESMDQALRRGGAKAIQDISVGSIAFERERQNPVFRR